MDNMVAALVIGPVIGMIIFFALQQRLPRKHWTRTASRGASDALRRVRQNRRLPLRPPNLKRQAARLIPPSAHVDSFEIEELLKRYAREQFGGGFAHQHRQGESTEIGRLDHGEPRNATTSNRAAGRSC